MREIKIRAPLGASKKLSHLALQSGISEATSHVVRVHGAAAEEAEEFKVKSSAPRIKAFLSALSRAPFYERSGYQVSAHAVLAIVGRETLSSVTAPVPVPFMEIQQDLWQYCQLTASFAVRAAVSAGLLAYALIKDDTVLAIGAMIFTPFSPLVLAMAFGLASRCARLTAQGVKAFLAALALTVAAAALTAAAAGGPLLFANFGGLGTNLAMSATIGLLAAVADADEVGRRQLIGLAMAYPFVKFPVWMGIALIQGFPDRTTTFSRLGALAGNAILMTLTAAFVYRSMARGGEVGALPQ